MAVSVEQFVKQLEDNGILADGVLSDFLPPRMTPKNAEELARELVKQKKLTRFQAEESYRGRAKSLVLGNYVLMEKIGAGGMGQVFKARHRRMNRLVAVKLLPPAMTKNKAAIARFEREVRAAARLRHPNIVAADDADQANGLHFLVMELVEGGDLSALVKKNGPFSVDRSLNYILQAARGLEAAHAEGIIHRDIKPANLLLDKKETVKILDMGLARFEGGDEDSDESELTSTGAVMGTVDYMAPEQAVDTKSADARADIYSLGCTLFYLLSGNVTYDGDSLMAKLLNHREQPIPSLRALRPDVNEHLDAVFCKMVAKTVEDRYQTMTEVIRGLEACRSGTFAQGGSSTQVGSSASTSDFSMSTIDEQTDPLAFLSNLSGQTLPVTRVSHPATRQSKQKAAPTSTNAASEATILTSNQTQDTDPQTITSTPDRVAAKTRARSKAGESPPWWRDVRVQAGGGAIFVLLLLAVIFLLKTPNGTLRVEILDPEVEMRVKGTELTFQGTNLQPISLQAGEKKLLVTRGDLTFETEAFTLRKGTETRVRVELLGDKLIVNGDGRVIAEQSISSGGVPGTSEGMTTSNTGTESVNGASPGAVSFEAVNVPPGTSTSKLFMHDSAFPQWLKDVQGMVVEQQIRAVSRKLRELNPGFDGKLGLELIPSQGIGGTPRIENGEVTQLAMYSDRVTDLSPIRALAGLRFLQCDGSDFNGILRDVSPLQGMRLAELRLNGNPQLSDISPLHGLLLNSLDIQKTAITDLTPLREMPLNHLNLHGCDEVVDLSPLKDLPLTFLATTSQSIADLSPLQGMRLRTFSCWSPLVTDFSPLQGMPLSFLELHRTRIDDLSILRGMPLTHLDLFECINITDFSPLKELPLEEIRFEFKPERDTEILRSIKTLRRINSELATEFLAATESQPTPVTRPVGATPSLAIAPFDGAQAKAYQEAWATHLGVPVEFTNSFGMTFRLIPPGEFMMGTDKAEIEANSQSVQPAAHRATYLNSANDSTPRHLVRISRPFYMQTLDVTNAVYLKVVGERPVPNPSFPSDSYFLNPDFPLSNNITLSIAAEFCDVLSRKEGKTPAYQIVDGKRKRNLRSNGYRLPTEAEWEYACRAGTTTWCFFGNATDGSKLSDYQTEYSGRFAKPNPFGLFDLYGGSSEWCYDLRAAYGSDAVVDPFTEPGDMDGVSRGGSHFAGGGSDFSVCNSVIRTPIRPYPVDHYYGLGRVILPIESQ
ncbi:MAG: protein kinase [Planctomyces sp.]|nr:protein kinase [Planctomyces sp.]